jgi:hypothetical protein
VYFLAVQRPAQGIADLRNRRVENAYFLDRISPLSQQFLAIHPGGAARWELGADTNWSHGWQTANGALPPWTYPLQLAVALQGREPLARAYLLLLDLVALAVVGRLAYARIAGRGADRAATALVILSPLAIGAVDNAMTQGQNALIVNAGLALVLAALVRRPEWGRAVGSGVAFAVAMIKPSSAVLFALPIAARRRWLLLATSAGVLGVATLVCSWWLRQPVLFQWRQFEQLSRFVVSEGANPALNALAAGTSARIAREVFGVAGVAIAGAAVYRLRRAPIFVLFAVTAVLSRLFTYHRAYDDVLLGFLMIELAGRAWSPGRSRRWLFAWFAGGVSLWLPYSMYTSRWAQECQLVTWCGLAMALVASEMCERGESNPQSLTATGS